MAKKDDMDVDELKEAFENLKTKMEDLEDSYATKLKRKFMSTEKDFERKIEENPMSSIGIAFGAGIVAGVVSYWLAKRK